MVEHSPSNMENKLDPMVHKLRQDEERYQRCIRQSGTAAGGSFCICDMFFWFIGKRSAAITKTFADAIQQRNHFVSPALVRLQLSSLLGLCAARYHEKGLHECVEEWMKGKHFSQMLDNSVDGGQVMKDGRLLKRIDDELPDRVGSIAELYGMASGWVHLDPKFFHALTQFVGEEGQVQFLLYGPEYEIPHMHMADERNWVTNMLSINNLIILQLLGWSACKQGIWGNLEWAKTDEEISTLKIRPQEIVVRTNGFEAVLVEQGDVHESERFALWVNGTNPSRNLAFARFATKEQAEEFASWYIQNMNESQNHADEDAAN